MRKKILKGMFLLMLSVCVPIYGISDIQAEVSDTPVSEVESDKQNGTSETEYNELKEEYDKLQEDYTDLEIKYNALESKYKKTQKQNKRLKAQLLEYQNSTDNQSIKESTSKKAAGTSEKADPEPEKADVSDPVQEETSQSSTPDAAGSSSDSGVVDVIDPNSVFAEGLDEYFSGQYQYITNDDLQKYASNLNGVKIYVVTQVSELDDDKIQATLSDGFMMSNFELRKGSKKSLDSIEEDETVAILGTVSGVHTYSFMGTSVQISDCLVFAVGNDAEKYRKNQSSDGLAGYLTVTESVANSNNKISESEYKGLCSYYSYYDIVRNPDAYKGKYAFVSGTVDQVIQGFFGGVTIYVRDETGEKWECLYVYKDGEPHVLEGDYINVYGKCKGTTTSTTIFGAQMILPYIDAEYIE